MGGGPQMPTFHPADTWPHRKIDRPTCSHCGWIMWLARVEPDKPGYDRRTFECVHCQRTQELVVEIEQQEPSSGS